MTKFTKIAAIAVFAFAFAFATSAAVTVPPNLMQGSSGTQVMNLQTALGIGADGAFGPITKSAVMSYQAGHGLTADGIVGPMTASSINGSAMVGSLPAGCTSTTGFSTTTGMSCSTGSTTLPAGCTAGAMYSSTTGMSCTGGTTTPSTNGPLSGGAGSITIDSLSTYSNEEVGEGQEDAMIAAFEIEADDESDVEITSVKVEFFEQSGTNSEDLSDYAESVSIWMDGEMVGESDVEDFNENSDVYSKSISIDGAIVRSGETEKFVIAINANNNLDSGDIDNDDWQAGVSSIRFEDAEGVVTTESLTLDIEDNVVDDTIEQEFDFADFATANDVELEADLTNDNPEEGVVIGDSSDETEVLMLSFEYTADGSDLNLESMEFDITSTGADTDEVASEITLKWGDEEQTESVPDAGAMTDDIVFDDLDLDIEDGDSMEFEVWATIKDVDGAPLVNGDTFKVDLDVSETEATDESGEDLVGGDLTGTANGEAQHIFTEAVEVTYVDSDIDPVDNGDAASESATAMLKISIKALGGTVYLNGDSESTAADEGLGVVAVGADTLSAYEFVTTGDYEVTNLDADNEYYTIDENDTMTITINATITQAAAATVLGGIALDEVQFGTVVTDQTTRSANVMNWSDLLEDLKSGKTTLVGV